MAPGAAEQLAIDAAPLKLTKTQVRIVDQPDQLRANPAEITRRDEWLQLPRRPVQRLIKIAMGLILGTLLPIQSTEQAKQASGNQRQPPNPETRQS